MDSNRFTGADKTRRNLKATVILSVPVLLLLVFLIVVKGIVEAWAGLVIVAVLWGLIYWRFKGVGGQGLPPQA